MDIKQYNSLLANKWPFSEAGKIWCRTNHVSSHLHAQWPRGGNVKEKADIALPGNPISELRDITCHMGSQCYLPPDTNWMHPAYPQPCRLVLDLPTPEGWKAQLT